MVLKKRLDDVLRREIFKVVRTLTQNNAIKIGHVSERHAGVIGQDFTKIRVFNGI